MVLKHRRPLPTPDEAMHDLLEEETTASLTQELGDASTGAALFTQRGGYRGRGRCGRGGRGGHGGHGGHSGYGGSSRTGDSHESKCTYCKSDSDTTDAYRKRKRAQEGGNNGANDERIFFPAQAPRSCQSRLRLLQTYKGGVESEESHYYSSPRYDRRLRSLLTNRLCSRRRPGSEVGH